MEITNEIKYILSNIISTIESQIEIDKQEEEEETTNKYVEVVNITGLFKGKKQHKSTTITRLIEWDGIYLFFILFCF